MRQLETPLLNKRLIIKAIIDSFVRLNPSYLYNNLVVFATEICAFLSSLCCIYYYYKSYDMLMIKTSMQISLWLWLTVLFSNFAEAIAETRGIARTESFRKIKNEIDTKKLKNIDLREFEIVKSYQLDVGDIVLVEAGDIIPLDGEILSGIATVNEAAITGESAPVIREAGGDRSSVTGGTKVISDSLIIKITSKKGCSFIDQMIKLVEGAQRQKTPNEIALNILLVDMTGIYLVALFAVYLYSVYYRINIPFVYLIALFIALIPTTISGLLSAIGISGMEKLIKYNIVAKSGRAVEAAGDIHTMLLDKTGTITLGNRMATEFLPLYGFVERDIAYAAFLSSLHDDTPEGKSIVSLATEKFKFNLVQEIAKIKEIIPFSAKTRISGVNFGDNIIKKGAIDAILALSTELPETKIREIKKLAEKIAKTGGTPLLVIKDNVIIGLIHLKDVIKPGLKERFVALRKMGIRTVMITGDNPLTAATIAAEAGVDDFIAEVTPEKKMEFIKQEQVDGKLVAMCGDGSNDAPALAQSDVAIAMNAGTSAAKEACNMIDLDNNPTKIIDIIFVGRELLMSRGALTTFSFANDISKYFVITPALFIERFPEMAEFNFMSLHSPESAILSAIIFNALIVFFLIPVALVGVKYQPKSASEILIRNLFFYGFGGILTPFIGIKLIDSIISLLGLV